MNNNSIEKKAFKHKNHANENGATLVEFAIILPLFIILIFGIIEFGLVLYNKGIITRAAREGARAGAVYNVGSAIDIEGVVEYYINNNLVSFASPKPDPGIGVVILDQNGIVKTGQLNCPLTAQSKESIKVTVSYPYTFLILPNFVTGLVGDDPSNPLKLESEAVMICE